MDFKLRDAVNVERVTQYCYREMKYASETDKRRDCVYGFKEINTKCYDCKWFATNRERKMIVTGKHIKEFIKFVHKRVPTILDRQKNIIELGKDLNKQAERLKLTAKQDTNLGD